MSVSHCFFIIFNKRNISDMKKTRKYKLMRSDDLMFIGEIEIRDDDLMFIDRIRYMKIGMLALVAVLIVISVLFAVKYTTTVSALNRKIENSISEIACERDSCANAIKEIERSDKFSIVCAEVFCYAECETLTHDKLWEFIQECDPWYPDIIMMQAVIESGCGKSDVAKRCHNLFGMKKPGARGLRCDINRWNKKETYAEYPNWKASVIDRILWDKWLFRDRKTKPTIEEYLDMLDKVYNTEIDGYAKGLYKQAAKYRKNKKHP